MTAFEVDLDALTDAVTAMAACQRRLVALASDVQSLQAGLATDWSGRAADARAASYHRWREDCADMVTALAGLRAVAASAEEHYRAAVAANLAMWERVR